MTISSLITELQKLQALHGDLPVTYPQGEHGDPEVIYDLTLFTGGYYDRLGKSNMPEGPHIHLS